MKTFGQLILSAWAFAQLGCNVLIDGPMFATYVATEPLQARLKVEDAECSRIYLVNCYTQSVHELDPSTGKIRKSAVFPRMKPSGSDGQYLVSPRGRKVALREMIRPHGRKGPTLGTRVWIADLSSGEQQFVAESEEHMYLQSWLSGGRSLAFAVKSGTLEANFVHDMETGRTHEVPEPPFRRLRIRRDRHEFPGEIVVCTPEGDERVIGRGYRAQLSPLGQIAFMSGKRRLTISDLEGNVLQDIKLRKADSLVTFSPCGRYLLLQGSVAAGIFYYLDRLTIVDLETGRQISHTSPNTSWDLRGIVWARTCDPGQADPG